MHHITVTICEDAQDAIARGYHYAEQNKIEPGKWTGLEITECVIVKGGMQSGVPSIDFIMKDSNGKQYIGMLTGNLFGMISGAMIGASNGLN